MTDRHGHEGFDPEEVVAAERLDAVIAAVQAGEPAMESVDGAVAGDRDATVSWLVDEFRAPVPAGLSARLRGHAAEATRTARLWTVTRAMTAALAALFLFQGSSNLVAGEWVAHGLGEPYGPHAFTEAGLAFIAVGLAVAAGALRRAWLPVAVVAGAPLGLLLGVRGVQEVEHFAAGAALHLSQGLASLCLLAGWLAIRRYGRTWEREEKGDAKSRKEKT